MQVFYCGLPGAGKSHEMVRTEVVPALKAGRLIVTNLPLRLERLAEVYPEAWSLVRVVQRKPGGPYPFATIEDYTDHAAWRHPEHPEMGPVYIIDEAAKSLPPAGSGIVAQQIKEFFKEHRHYGAKMVIGAQQFEDVEKSIRMLSEYVYAMKALGFLGLKSHYWRRTYFGPVAPSKGKNPDKIERRKYEKTVFELYQSHMHGGGVVEERREKPWFMRKRYAVILAVVAYFVWSSWALVGGGGDTGSTAARATSTSSGAVTPEQRVQILNQALQAGAASAPKTHPLKGRLLAHGGSLFEGHRIEPFLMLDGRRVDLRALQLMGYDVQVRDTFVIVSHKGAGESWFVSDTSGPTRL